MGVKITRHSGITSMLIAVMLATVLAALAFAAVPKEAQAAAPDNATTRAAIIKEARTYLGVPYVRGYPTPCSRSGVDCECLNRLVYAKFGVKLPITETGQAKVGVARSLSTIKPGDLMFWDENFNGVIDHTGMYYGKSSTGQHRVIHASTFTGNVTITEIRYLKGYKGARDILP